MKQKTVFERLYEKEQNFQVSCFWDGGYDFVIGDATNGWTARANFNTWPEGVQWFEEILAQGIDNVPWHWIEQHRRATKMTTTNVKESLLNKIAEATEEGACTIAAAYKLLAEAELAEAECAFRRTCTEQMESQRKVSGQVSASDEI